MENRPLEDYTTEELIEATKGFDEPHLVEEHPLRKMVESIWGDFNMQLLVGTGVILAQELAERIENMKLRKNDLLDEVIKMYVPDGNPEVWLNKIMKLREVVSKK